VATISMIFLTINLPYFFASLLGGTLLYHRSPLSWCYLGERRSPKKIFGRTAFPIVYTIGCVCVCQAQ